MPTAEPPLRAAAQDPRFLPDPPQTARPQSVPAQDRRFLPDPTFAQPGAIAEPPVAPARTVRPERVFRYKFPWYSVFSCIPFVFFVSSL